LTFHDIEIWLNWFSSSTSSKAFCPATNQHDLDKQPVIEYLFTTEGSEILHTAVNRK
jgi:hypothetical protein